MGERESTSGGEERERKRERERERNERANGESRTRGCEALENTESVLDCSQRSLFFLCGASRREEANSCTLRHTARNHRKKGHDLHSGSFCFATGNGHDNLCQGERHVAYRVRDREQVGEPTYGLDFNS